LTCPHIYTQKTDIAIQFVYCEIGKLARILVTYSSQYARSGMEDALQRLKKGIEAEDEAENEAELAEADDEDGVCAAIHPMGVAVSVNKATGHFGSVGHNGVALVGTPTATVLAAAVMQRQQRQHCLVAASPTWTHIVATSVCRFGQTITPTLTPGVHSCRPRVSARNSIQR